MASASAPDLVRAAVERWDDLLASRHLASTVEHLQRETEARALHWHGRPWCTTLRPHFVDPAQHASVTAAAEATIGGLQIAFAVLRARPDLRRRLFLGDDIEALCAVDAGHPHAVAIVGRLDGFYGSDGVVRFIEYNGMPGGIVHCQVSAEVFAAMPIFAEVARDVSLRSDRPLDTLLGALEADHLTATGRRGLPAIAYALCHPDDGFRTAGPEIPIMAARIRDAGGDAHFGLPEEFTMVGGHLRCRGEAVDMVGCDDPVLLLRRHGLGHPVFEAVRRGTVRVLNGLSHAFTLSSKALFALVTDDTYSAAFPAATWRALQRHIPWTRVVEDVATTLDGRRVGLLDTVAGEKDRFVLKPVFAFGGAGVVLGHESTPDAWAAALAAAGETPYVVQERLELPVETFPLLGERGPEWVRAYHDADPYVWNNRRAYGVATRLSRTSLLNVTAGGSVAPVFMVAPR